MNRFAKTQRNWRLKGGVRPWLYLPFAFSAFLFLDFVLRLTYADRTVFSVWLPSATIATISWSLLLSSLSLFLSGRLRRVYLGATIGFFALLTVVHGVLQNLFRRFFLLSSLAFVADGAAFADRSYIELEPKILFGVLGALVLMFCAIMLAPGKGEIPRRKELIAGLSVTFLGMCGILAVRTLWLTPNPGLSWDNYNNPAAVYESFTDSTGALLASGLYQYTLRDAVITFGFGKAISREDHEDLNAFAQERRNARESNEYTGLFEGKNLILIQLEAIDTWMLTRDYMPNLYRLKQKSLVFENHYSPAYITAGTLNTEFMVNTGLIPAMGSVSVSTHERNAFPASLANQFRAAGYTAESFHGSEGNVYNRSVLHPNLGYERYHSGTTMGMESYMLDHYLMAGYEDMTKGNPFFSFVITYSGHGPYSKENGIYLEHAQQAEKKAKRQEENYVCAVAHAMETDRFIGELIKRLEQDGHLDDTVLAFYADHFNYYMMNDALNMEIKGVDNLNLLQHTDFFIYAKDQAPQKIEKVTSTLDILPTLSNLFGLDDKEAVYLGDDAFSDGGGYVFFSDGSSYDGESYLTANSPNSSQKAARTGEIAERFRMNNLLLQSDFFRAFGNYESFMPRKCFF